MEMLRLTELAPKRDRTGDSSELLSVDQREALHTAVTHGYYETPRQVDLSALADYLDIPRSTLSYRLRRAEAELAKQFTATDRSLHSLSPTV